MQATLRALAAILIFAGTEATVANLLADRALTKLSDWIKTDGSDWLTLPGHFQQGMIHRVENRFTLAFAGPKLASLGELTRSGDAALGEAEPDPLYVTKQKLHFKATLTNVTAVYQNVAYTEEDFGSYNFTPTASTVGTTVDVVLNVKGDMETCVGFPESIFVGTDGATSITVGDKQTDGSVPAVVSLVSSHFQSNVVNNLQTLMQSGIFTSLENYDLCNDAYDPLLPANMLAEQILEHAMEGLSTNVTNWAWLPGFWKQFHAPNGTVTNFLRVDVGHFNSPGNVRRVGDASYSNDGSQQTITMNFETDSMTAFYGNISFTDHNTEYHLSDKIETQKLSILLSVQFYKSPYMSVPMCNNQSLQVDVMYEGGPLQTQLNPSLPQELFDMVNSTVAEGFLRSLKEAATDLFHKAAFEAISAACPSNPNDALPDAKEMADKILAAMSQLVAEHHADWTHLPGTWKQYFAPNGTLIYYIAAGFGNFTNGGTMQRIDAAYTNDDSNLNIVFETDTMSATYGDVIYTSNWVRYKMVETIKTKKLKTSLSVSFSPDATTGIPTCYGGSVGSVVTYEGGDVDVENLTPGVPDDVQAMVAAQLSHAFINDVIGAVEELYTTVAINVLAEVCTHVT